jgi:hypothetical protein
MTLRRQMHLPASKRRLGIGGPGSHPAPAVGAKIVRSFPYGGTCHDDGLLLKPPRALSEAVVAPLISKPRTMFSCKPGSSVVLATDRGHPVDRQARRSLRKATTIKLGAHRSL